MTVRQSSVGWLHGDDLHRWVRLSVVSGRSAVVQNFLRSERQSCGRYTNHELIQLGVWLSDCLLSLPVVKTTPAQLHSRGFGGGSDKRFSNPALNPDSFAKNSTLQNSRSFDD